MATSINTTPSFNNAAATIIKALSAADNAAAKYSATLATTMQQYLDSCAVVGMLRDNAAVKAIGTEIRTCQSMLDAVATGMLEKKTVTEYAQSAMRAYFHEVPFAQGLKNDSAFQIPNANGEVRGGTIKAPTKAGKISKTTRAALLDTLTKALEQAKLLNLDMVHAILIDAACEIDPDFKV